MNVDQAIGWVQGLEDPISNCGQAAVALYNEVLRLREWQVQMVNKMAEKHLPVTFTELCNERGYKP